MSKKLLIIGFVWPEPKSSAAGSRMLQLIKLFQDMSYHITFATPCAQSEQAFDLSSIDVETKSIKLNDTSFDDYIKVLKPEIVLFDRFMMEEQFGWRVAEYCPNALRILDTEDLHGLRKGRQQAFKNKELFNDTHLFNDTTKRELASIYRCDLSLIISEMEVNLLESKFKVDKNLYHYLPFLIDSISEDYKVSLPKFEERQHFISIGNFLHEPNYNAVLYLKEVIWPLIREQLPYAELHIYGAYSSQKVEQLHNDKTGFIVKGFAEDAHLVMQKSRVCLAPIRFGAGLKGKLFDAMQNGAPSVTTTIGAEGIFGDLESNGFIEDSPEEFALNAIELYNNAKLWKNKQEQGFSILKNRFNKNTIQFKLVNRVQVLLKSIVKHRQENVVGQLLQHQSLQATKYLSKWITEKNKV